jgi:dTDP-4-amino-4,6-dideoxygalactose transaminase
MDKKIPLYIPFIGHLEAAAVARVLASRWLTQGPEVQAFESEFAAFVGAREACAVSNGTTALAIALQVAGVLPGDEVITVSLSFIATANSIVQLGAVPVFADVELGGINIDCSKVEALIGPKTKAILCVHQLGVPCNLKALAKIAQERNLVLIEDAACAIGSEIEIEGIYQRIGRPVGSLVCFSFHPRKLLTTGEGGMITTNDPEFTARIRRLRHHGMNLSDLARHQSATPQYESYSEPGYNYRMSDIQAAVGREQLKLLPALLQTRRKQAEYYRAHFSSVKGVMLHPEGSGMRSNWQSFWVTLAEKSKQDDVIRRAALNGISFRRGVMCAHLESAYPRGRYRCLCMKNPCVCLKESESVHQNTVLIPLYHEMTQADQNRVIEVFNEV